DQPRADEQHRRDRGVEHPVDRVRDVDEDLPGGVGAVVPFRDPGQHARGERTGRDQDPEDQDDLTRLDREPPAHGLKPNTAPLWWADYCSGPSGAGSTTPRS